MAYIVCYFINYDDIVTRYMYDLDLSEIIKWQTIISQVA